MRLFATAVEGASTASATESKFRQLKDRMWVRETLEDLTAAEFAATIDPAASTDKKKGGPDFELLLGKLGKRLEELCCVPDPYGNGSEECILQVKPGEGMGSVVYSNEQRNALLQRLLSTRDVVEQAMEGHAADGGGAPIQDLREKLKSSNVEESDEPAKKKKKTPDDLRVYVRADGTVDWDGALQDREALKKFGTAVWSRINGQDPETVDLEKGEENEDGSKQPAAKPVTVKIIETDEIRDKKAALDALIAELDEMEANHTTLLNSAINEGQVVAKFNFATLDPELRTRIRESDQNLENKREEVSFQMMNYELERIFTYLDREVGNTATTGYIPLQDRLNIAEFGLLESQFAAFLKQRGEGENIDSDVLAVVLEQLTDFKRRLGIDYYVTGLTFDNRAIRRWTGEMVEKSKSGLGFYIKGTRLFWNDLMFCLSLVGRAIGGYTLKPREVRTLRRTIKDLITFIPFIIILIIPLSPIGHVMVFGAIQRFFPDFFPSCFSEQRQNLLQLYETTEFSAVTIDESFKEKFVRVFSAFLFFWSSLFTRLYAKIGGTARKEIKTSTDLDTETDQ
eukprot:CAMPEP_0118691280 /NCGR_PEP_ID=MMETSP0800-20121206/10588_1 /TAXON_ID=210618 ORGANISM="Striatella unipunctata, Strain CCMP2910" /NCGR_SAMPLE_ID=MMETSP0800 /ASSEMBLY_ACC=CAM_ASM_000638 /LENGTH=568 /DNA_ID=CAMNT_0006589033 /DNA_START=198 /DNA_END=1904 /DNA_ORIENTATION=-